MSKKTINRPSITIIVPVYGDWSSLNDCIQSLIEHVDNQNSIILINDCGPQADIMEANIKRCIKGLKHFAYYRNSRNLGFGGTCNRAVFEIDATKNDVLILNSDTIVTNNFLEEMHRILYIEKNIGAVSPRSNNATICTIPISAISQKGVNSQISYKLFMRLKENFPRYSFTPTAHGFCILIRRNLIDKYGLFDSVFGRGYGEEVDFCQRIQKDGWQSAICNRAYVFHLEARSFTKETKVQLLTANNKIIRRRYPDYQQSVSDYIKRAEILEERIMFKHGLKPKIGAKNTIKNGLKKHKQVYNILKVTNKHFKQVWQRTNSKT